MRSIQINYEVLDMIESNHFGDVYSIYTNDDALDSGGKLQKIEGKKIEATMHCINKSKFSKRERTFFMKQV